LPASVSKLRKNLCEKIVSNHLASIKRIYGMRPISVNYWVRWRKLLGLMWHGSDVLFPSYDSLQEQGNILEEPELRQLLHDNILGLWSLDAQTISFIWINLWKEKPRFILECGSGLSTLVLAKYASVVTENRGYHHYVLSLEQSKKWKKEVELRLLEECLNDFVKILHVPLDNRNNYDFSRLANVQNFQNQKLDWILIDGPAGPAGCRCCTLPGLVKFCKKGTRWFMDDAFRDGELEVLVKWTKIQEIKIEGIYPIGKGLASGRVLA